MLMGYQYQNFAFQLGTPLKTLGYRLSGVIYSPTSLLGGYWIFDRLRRLFLLVVLYLPWLKNINARYCAHKLATQTQRKREKTLHPALGIRHAFLYRHIRPNSDLADMTNISIGSRGLTPSTSLV